MTDFLDFAEGNVSYMLEAKNEKEDIQLSDEWLSICTQSRVKLARQVAQIQKASPGFVYYTYTKNFLHAIA